MDQEKTPGGTGPGDNAPRQPAGGSTPPSNQGAGGAPKPPAGGQQPPGSQGRNGPPVPPPGTPMPPGFKGPGSTPPAGGQTPPARSGPPTPPPVPPAPPSAKGAAPSSTGGTPAGGTPPPGGPARPSSSGAPLPPPPPGGGNRPGATPPAGAPNQPAGQGATGATPAAGSSSNLPARSGGAGLTPPSKTTGGLPPRPPAGGPPVAGGPGAGKPSSGGPPIKLVGALVVVVAIAAALIVLATSGGGGGDEVATAPTPTRAPSTSGGLATDAIPTVEATIDLSRPTAVAAENLTELGQGDKVVISRLGVSQALAYHKVGLDGVMPDPSTPDEVAYYDFSAWPGLGGAPGKGGNTIISGHVDSGTKPCKNGTVPPPCTAVFWELRNLRIGDEVELQVGGQTFKYRVATNEPVSAKDDRWHQIVSSTQQETLTIITCGGQFNPATREYDLRTVVTALRI